MKNEVSRVFILVLLFGLKVMKLTQAQAQAQAGFLWVLKLLAYHFFGFSYIR